MRHEWRRPCRQGDTLIADVAWSEPVTRPYGGYLMAASNGRQHIKQADVTLNQVAANTLTAWRCSLTPS